MDEELFKKAEEFCDKNWAAVSITIRPKQASGGQCIQDGMRYHAKITYGGQGAYSGPEAYSSEAKDAVNKALKLATAYIP